MGRLFLLFTVVPALELFLLIQLGAFMGPLPTFLLVVVTGFVGASLARREGLSVLRQLAEDASRGIPPAERLVEAGLVAAGGLLLVTPGVLTDLFGLALIVPVTRRLVAPSVWRWLSARVTVTGLGAGAGFPEADPFGPPPGARRPPPRPGSPPPFDHPVA